MDHKKQVKNSTENSSDCQSDAHKKWPPQIDKGVGVDRPSHIADTFEGADAVRDGGVHQFTILRIGWSAVCGKLMKAENRGFAIPKNGL